MTLNLLRFSECTGMGITHRPHVCIMRFDNAFDNAKLVSSVNEIEWQETEDSNAWGRQASSVRAVHDRYSRLLLEVVPSGCGSGTSLQYVSHTRPPCAKL
ncbi:hypothetical protein NPIL_609891 [Nephila pilipes]|uniref:Uncharacterized protein n=1 Tax=Nephila pilipes TaxID=299642 RepID=A0A8X6JS88_NEPPI|nr:hypothetical protein NPIL_609891 [Nephila pilipes]